MLGVFGDRHGTRRSREEIQVINVISRSSHHWMVTAADEDGIPVSGFDSALGRVLPRVKMLEGEGLGLVHAVVVDLVEIDFARWIVHIMLMGRITRPVSAGGIDLDHDEFVRRKGRRDDVDDLA